jgi:predicted outer membrane repeat protein
VVGVVAVAGPAAAGGTATVDTGAEFAAAFVDPTTDVIEMTDDITLPSALTRPAGADPLVINGNGFTLTAAPNSGMLQGGGPNPVGDLEINDLTLTGANPAIGQLGVILWFDGTVTLNRSSLVDNVSLTTPIRVSDQDGIGDEAITANDSVFDNNRGANGGVLRADTVIVNRSTFTDNNAGNGGAIDSNVTATVSDSVFLRNHANGSHGGAISSSGPLGVNRSSFSGNTARTDGGAIQSGAEVTLTQSTVSGNTADGNGGGMSVLGDLTLVNSTVTGNDAGGQGGGVHAFGLISLTYSTVVDNDAPTGANVAVVQGGSLEVFATVVSQPGGGGDNCEGTASTSEFAYEAGGSSCGFDLSDQPDPQLGALGDNGGPTATMLPAATSPLIDAVTDCGSITVDQRGVTRPQGDACDIGAVEVGADDLPPGEPPTPVPVAPTFTG